MFSFFPLQALGVYLQRKATIEKSSPALARVTTCLFLLLTTPLVTEPFLLIFQSDYRLECLSSIARGLALFA